MSHEENGDNYNNSDEYYSDLFQSSAYCGFCELIATGKNMIS